MTKLDSDLPQNPIGSEDYLAIFQYCDDAILLTVPDGTILAANPSACRMFQRTEAEICALGRKGLVDPNDPNLQTAVQSRMVNGVFVGILNFIKADGSVFAGEVSTRIFTKQDHQQRSVMVIRDVTDRLAMEKQLADSEQRYRSVLDNMMEGCQILDFDFRYRYLNDTAIGHSRHRREDLIGRTMTEVYPGIETSPLFSVLLSCMTQRKPAFYVNAFTFEDGTSGEFELYIQPVSEGLFILSLDVTQRKEAETHLKQNQEILKLFGEYAPAAIAMLDNDMRYLATTKRYLKDYGLPDESILGRSHYEVFPELPERWKAIHRRCLNGEHLFAEADPFVREDGHTDYVSWQIHPWYRNDRQIGGIILFSEVITQRKNAEDLSRRNEQKLLETMIDTIEMVAKTLEMRDPYTAGHESRVTILAVAIAERMGLAQQDIEGIRLASIVHDLGKISIPAEILSKPGTLTPLEYSFIKTHVESGYNILKGIQFPWPIAEIVLQHHERINGSGYPKGLKGDQLLIQSKILAVADVIEAMASHRPYRPSVGVKAALQEITDQKGILFDPAVVDACLSVFDNGFSFESTPH